MPHDRRRRMLGISAGCLAILVGAAFPSFCQEKGSPTKGISVAQPKIWRYERIYPLLDGMLRDIENTSISAMTTLDPNKANLQYLDFLQSMVSLQVSYSQATGLKNQVAVSQANVQVRQLELDNQYLTSLKEQRNAAISEETTALKRQVAAQQKVDNLQQKVNALVPTSTEGKSAKTQLDLAKQELATITGEVGGLQTQVQNLSDNINKVSTTVNAPAVSDVITNNQPLTAAPTPPKFLDQVPADVQSKLFSKFGGSDLPASKQLENYLTLLNERLAKELSVIADDATQQGYDLYLMQFDVAFYPPRNTKKHVGKVEISVGEGCPPVEKQAAPKKVPYAYSLIPGASAYNIQEFIGRHQYFSFLGIFNLLSGLGVSGAYQRQRDQLHDGLVQSIYQSGYMNGLTSFGWYYGPSPFEGYLTPGIRSTYALVAVPRERTCEDLAVGVSSGWQDQHDRISGKTNSTNFAVHIPPPDPEDPIDTSVTSDTSPDQPPEMQSSLWSAISRIAYQTIFVAPTQTGAKPDPSSLFNTVLIVLRRAADPDLVVTVNGTLLKRARDTRGEAVRLVSNASTPAPPRGIFEAEDFGSPDTWILLNPRTLLLKISRQTAGDLFPTIRLSDPSLPSGDLRYILSYSKSTKVDINNWTFRPRYGTKIPLSAFAPLFVTVPVSIDRYLQVSVDDFRIVEQPAPRRDPTLIRIAFHPSDDDPKVQNRKLNESAQIVLETVDSAKSGTWPLQCTANSDDLVCHVPVGICDHDKVCESPTRWRLSVSDRLDPATIVHTDADAAPVDVRGSTILEDFMVRPHFDSTYDKVEYDVERSAWDIYLKGHNFAFVDYPQSGASLVVEMNGCPAAEDVALLSASGTDDLMLVIPTVALHCMSSDVHGPFHLRYLKDHEAAIVDIPNLQWAILAGGVGNLSIERMEGNIYRLRVPSLQVDGMRSVTPFGPKNHALIPLTKLTPDSLRFQISDDMATSASPYNFTIQVAEANVYAYSDTSNSMLLCFNFRLGTDCASTQGKPKSGTQLSPVDKKPETSTADKAAQAAVPKPTDAVVAGQKPATSTTTENKNATDKSTKAAVPKQSSAKKSKKATADQPKKAAGKKTDKSPGQ